MVARDVTLVLADREIAISPSLLITTSHLTHHTTSHPTHPTPLSPGHMHLMLHMGHDTLTLELAPIPMTCAESQGCLW